MENKKMEKLFQEFPPVPTSRWEEEITKDLKGADYNKKLIWNTPDGLNVRPYYRQEDLADKGYLDALPGSFPYTRGNKTDSNDWEIRQDILLHDIANANQKSLFVLDRGVTSLGFVIDKDWPVLKSQSDFSALLKNIYFECISLNFIGSKSPLTLLELLKAETQNKNIDPVKISGSIDFDPLGNLTVSGNFFENETSDFKTLNDLFIFASENLPAYRVLGINGYFFNNAGASIVQELAYSLSMANDYLVKLTDSGLSVDTICRHLQFNFGVGVNYFMEIAKIRAARVLWAKIAESHKPSDANSSKAFIHSVTSEWNQTIYDPYVNVLRATTESMSAVVGGTDSLSVRPFDYSYKETSKFSGRLARNIQIILKEEAYLDRVVDPGAGSYYIENLTNSIIDEAWKLFLKIEDQGGYLEALKKGIIQTEIKTSATTRNNLIATRREVLLGTNQYANINESIQDVVREDLAFADKVSVNTTVEPIVKFRGAMAFEKLRLAVEKRKEGRPKVFMLTYGNLVMRKARAAFACNFFACAGYELIDNLGFESIDDGIKAAFEAKADIVVVCSSDDEYIEIVPKAFAQVKDKIILVVAGAPACMDELKTIGVEHFIHVKSNLLETLKQFHQKLGIKL
jgi:methylmalonyl-CoA mutase